MHMGPENRIESVYFLPDIFYFSIEPLPLKLQVQGIALSYINPDDLASGINTDQIIPADACKNPDPENLGRFVMTGLKDSLIKPGDMVSVWPNVWVAGDYFGSGSSREHAPIAMQNAGCSLVIAKSFSPIFRRNCVNVGIIPSTDFTLIDRVKRGQAIPLNDLVDTLNPLEREIVSSGGLLRYLQLIHEGKISIPEIHTNPRPMTITEKWFARYLKTEFVKPGDGGVVRPETMYSYEYTVPISADLLDTTFGKDGYHIIDPSSIVLFNDHLSLDGTDARSLNLEKITRDFASKHGIRLYDIPFSGKSQTELEAICHITMMKIAPPGLIVGTDSHTTMLGPIGLAFGIGATDAAGYMKTGEILTVVPETAQVIITGSLPEYMSVRDIALYLSLFNKQTGQLTGRAIEYAGESIDNMNMDDLAILANQAAEMRAVNAVFPPLQTIAEYLVSTGRADSSKKALLLYPDADPDAEYSSVIQIHVDQLQPMVAVPSSPDNVIPLTELPNTVVTKVIIGSCAGGNIDDIRTAASLLSGRHIHPDTKLIIHPNSVAVLHQAKKEGLTEIIEKTGGQIINAIGCGSCIGVGPEIIREQDICFTTATRNHEGRMGHPKGRVYLANPLICTASAILGHSPSMEDLSDLCHHKR